MKLLLALAVSTTVLSSSIAFAAMDKPVRVKFVADRKSVV